MEDSATVVPDTSVVDSTPSSTTTYTDPISSLFGGFFFIIILVLIIILVVIIMLGRGIGWIANTATGKDTFENPKKPVVGPTGPAPWSEADDAFADFPQI